MSEHEDAEDWARAAVCALRREGLSPRGVLRAFERRWTSLSEPGWDDVVDKVAVAWFTARNNRRLAAKRGAGPAGEAGRSGVGGEAEFARGAA